MNLFCKMIIGCNKEMMDFITHRLWHCVIEVSKDSRVMGVGKDSGWYMVESHLISWHVELQPRIA